MKTQIEGKVQFLVTQKVLIFQYLRFGFEIIKTCHSYQSRKIHTGEINHSAKEIKVIQPGHSG